MRSIRSRSPLWALSLAATFGWAGGARADGAALEMRRGCLLTPEAAQAWDFEAKGGDPGHFVPRLVFAEGAGEDVEAKKGIARVVVNRAHSREAGWFRHDPAVAQSPYSETVTAARQFDGYGSPLWRLVSNAVSDPGQVRLRQGTWNCDAFNEAVLAAWWGMSGLSDAALARDVLYFARHGTPAPIVLDPKTLHLTLTYDHTDFYELALPGHGRPATPTRAAAAPGAVPAGCEAAAAEALRAGLHDLRAFCEDGKAANPASWTAAACAALKRQKPAHVRLVLLPAHCEADCGKVGRAAFWKEGDIRFLVTGRVRAGRCRAEDFLVDERPGRGHLRKTKRAYFEGERAAARLDPAAAAAQEHVDEAEAADVDRIEKTGAETELVEANRGLAE
ncbi:MAG: hypothetical protein ACYDCL_01470 [Myxococcales bacterium]